MNTLRAILGILGGGATGYVIAVIITGLATPRDIGVGVAVTAACVIGIYLIRAIDSDRQRKADKALHPSSYRIEVVDGYPLATAFAPNKRRLRCGTY